MAGTVAVPLHDAITAGRKTQSNNNRAKLPILTHDGSARL